MKTQFNPYSTDIKKYKKISLVPYSSSGECYLKSNRRLINSTLEPKSARSLQADPANYTTANLGKFA